MNPLHSFHYHHRRHERGVALILTLAILVLLTIFVVAYAVMARMEIISARSSLEGEQAQYLGGIGIDDVVAKLRDNIPLNEPWAVEPGQLCFYNSSTATWTTVNLYSGAAASSTTGTIALNAPLPGESTSYPIVPVNTEYPTPNPMLVAWINVLQDGTRSIDSGYSPNKSNPIVGRYAYWVDTETSKVNLNTAGNAKTTYNFVSGAGDIENLTAHPSRVDLSQLDNSSGTITSAQSVATYNSTASSYWYGAGSNNDQLGTPTTTPNVRTAGEGMTRFDSIYDWVNISGITSSEIEANKFYLTTRAWTPELTPWGLNKLWWQNNAPQIATTTSPFQPGNRLDAPGLPNYNTPAAGSANIPEVSGANADFKYYVYPTYRGSTLSTTGTTDLEGITSYDSMGLNMQWMGANAIYHNAVNTTKTMSTFMHNMMYELNRRDWPGMPAASFVDKYGQAECEDLAFNMLYLYDSAVNYGGPVPGNLFTESSAGSSPAAPYMGPNGHDYYGVYGGCSMVYSPTSSYPTPTASSPGGRLMGGVGPWPYINEIAVTFTPTTSGSTCSFTSNPITGYAGDGTANTGTLLATKDSNGPGFAPAINTLPSSFSSCVNVKIQPVMEVTYPLNLAQGNNYQTVQAYKSNTPIDWAGISDIEVTATGTLTGKPVTYTGSNFIWGFPDDHPSTFAVGDFIQFFNGPQVVLPNSTPQAGVNLPAFYIGPFDAFTTPQITVKFRAFQRCQNIWSGMFARELTPLGWDYPASASAEVNDTTGTKLDYTASVNLASPTGTTSSLELVDPRVYRYRTDWQRCTAAAGKTIGATNSVYVSSYPDTLTGITGDDSKLAWPNVAAMDALRYADPPIDPRWSQNAGNIVGFPGIGWLSVLPTNCESGGGTWDSTFTIRSGGATPIPWRTLSLQPSTQATQLPDWLLLEAFALANEHTFLSQSEGKININASINPFNFNRLGPLKALLIPSSANSTTTAATIANDLADHTGANTGPCAELPSNIYVYAGQLCQVPSMTGSGTNQYQKEALMRDLAGLVTTQCSDFNVHVISQVVKQISYTGNLSSDLVVTGQERLDAIVSRTVDVGPDGVPGTSDDMAGPDHNTGTADDLTFKAVDGTTITKLKYDGTDKPLQGFAGSPPFHYQITSVKYVTQ